MPSRCRVCWWRCDSKELVQDCATAGMSREQENRLIIFEFLNYFRDNLHIWIFFSEWLFQSSLSVFKRASPVIDWNFYNAMTDTTPQRTPNRPTCLCRPVFLALVSANVSNCLADSLHVSCGQLNATPSPPHSQAMNSDPLTFNSINHLLTNTT